MPTTPSVPRVGIYAPDQTTSPAAWGCVPAAPGCAAAVAAAGAIPVPLRLLPGCSWDELLDDIDGVVCAGPARARRQADGERLCRWCRALGLPLLAVGGGL